MCTRTWYSAWDSPWESTPGCPHGNVCMITCTSAAGSWWNTPSSWVSQREWGFPRESPLSQHLQPHPLIYKIVCAFNFCKGSRWKISNLWNANVLRSTTMRYYYYHPEEVGHDFRGMRVKLSRTINNALFCWLSRLKFQPAESAK